MTQKQFFVYTHAKPNTTDVHGIFYVGKGDSNRSSKAERKHNRYHLRITKKYGVENIIIRKLACRSEQHAFNLEVQMIAALRKMDVSLVNVAEGGEGTSGYKFTPEQKNNVTLRNLERSKDSSYAKKLSNAQKNRFLSEVEIEKRSVIAKAQWQSEGFVEKQMASRKVAYSNPETRAKMSESGKARPPISEETREKMALAMKARHEKRKSEGIQNWGGRRCKDST